MATRKYKWHGVTGERPRTLVEDEDLLVVRTRDTKGLLQWLGQEDWQGALAGLEVPLVYPKAGMLLLQERDKKRRERVNPDDLQSLLDGLEFKARAEWGLRLADTGDPVLVLPSIQVRFRDRVSRDQAEAFLRDIHGDPLEFTSERVPYGRALAYNLATRAKSTRKTFAFCDRLRDDELVENAYPHLTSRIRPAAAQEDEWPLRGCQVEVPAGSSGPATWDIIAGHASVVAAWSLTRGKRVIGFYQPFPWVAPLKRVRRIRVAVLDEGIDIDHPEFKGWRKVVKPSRNFLSCGGPYDPRPPVNSSETHGTIMAGLAVGNGSNGSSGTAPGAALIAIRIFGQCYGSFENVSTEEMAKAFYFAAKSKADVISCSWYWPLIDDGVKDAMSYATTTGRNGDGCMILFAAGNTGEASALHLNPYASRGDVTAVAACSRTGEPHALAIGGKKLWCMFPTADFAGGHVNPVYVLDPTQSGVGQPVDQYVVDYHGGSSHACAATAGVVALMLARNYTLPWKVVKHHLGATCDKVDFDSGDYPSSHGRSDRHGYGRVHALRAVMAVS